MKNKPLKSILKDLYLFSAMNDKELDDLTKICSIHNYTKDSYLFMKGETSEYLLVLVEGLVSIFKHDDKGNEIIMALFSPVSLLAEPAILKGVPFPSSAVFKSSGAVVKIKLNEFKDDFLHNPNVSYAVIQSLLEKVQILQNNIHLNIASSAKEKVLYFYQKNNDQKVEIKQYEIASLLGITAETFSRNLKNLLKEGRLFKTDNGYKTIDI